MLASTFPPDAVLLVGTLEGADIDPLTDNRIRWTFY